MARDPRIQQTSKPVIFHPDLHTENIFVLEENPSIVTAIIDWQSTSIQPAFWYADDVPDFARSVYEATDNKEMEPISEACAGAHNVCTQFFTPRIAEPRLMDERLFRSFRYCHRTWVDGAAAFREELIQISRCWQELGLEGECPYSLPSAEELAILQKDYKFFEVAQVLKDHLSDLLGCQIDGWVPAEEWEQTKSTHAKLFRTFLGCLPGEYLGPDEDDVIRNEGDAREIWPFDVDELD